MSHVLIPINEFDLRMTEESWPFSNTHREEINEYWNDAVARNPHIWNGEVLIGMNARIENHKFQASFVRTNFASVIAWRGLEHIDEARHVFGMPGIITQDGAMVFGIMAEHTYNAGRVYPPGGSLDPNDITADGTVDVLGSITREMGEETGLRAAEAKQGGLYVLPMGRAMTVVSYLHFPYTAQEMERMIQHYLDAEEEAELSGLWIVRQASDITSKMSGFAIEMAKFFLDRRDRLTAL